MFFKGGKSFPFDLLGYVVGFGLAFCLFRRKPQDIWKSAAVRSCFFLFFFFVSDVKTVFVHFSETQSFCMHSTLTFLHLTHVELP